MSATGGGAARRASPAAAAALLASCAAVAVTIAVHRRALGAFFTPDDLVFLRLARAAGTAGGPPSAWRWLSSVTFRALANGPFGLEPAPYHALNLALLAAAVALLFLLARRWGASVPAAFAGAACFGASRVHHTALASASSHGEFLAAGLLLAALSSLARSRARFTAAVCLLLAAMLAKESVLLVPFACVVAARGTSPRREHLRLALVALVGGALLLAAGRSSGALAGGAYSIGFGANLAHAAFTLLGWSLDFATPIPDLATEPDPRAFVFGLPVAAALVAAAWWGRRRAPLVTVGLAWWLLAVAPVLPLVHQTYLHYLVTPWAGLGLAIAGALDLALERIAVRRAASGAAERASVAVAAAFALVAVFAAAQDHLLARRHDERLPVGDVPRDPVLRKSEFARRVVQETAAGLTPGCSRVAYFVLDGAQDRLDMRSGDRAAVRDPDAEPLRHALTVTLDEGRVLRLLVPAVDSVVFVRRWAGPLEGFDHFYAFGDMRVQPLGSGPDAYERMALALVKSGHPEPAAALLDSATAAWPDRPSLLWAHSVALARTGQSRRARARLHEIVRIAPGDAAAARAREALAAIQEPGEPGRRE